MITREQAVDILEELVESEVLNENLRDALDEMAMVIHYEKIGLHLWGADNKDFEDDEALEKYVYIPSDFEEVAVLNERKMLDEETVSEPSEAENTENDK
jgi:hypothetical protein